MSFNINKTPFFTVIVPVYNTNESYLIAAIESVINQTFKDYELIIVDDASTVDYKIKIITILNISETKQTKERFTQENWSD